jgi:uncharacterized protein (DUF1697 family)
MAARSKETYIALLRGINVGGHNPVPMAELRPLCESLGWHDVRTYIQSGNVVLRSDADAARLEQELEAAIAGRFDLVIPVIVRAATWWSRALTRNPHTDAAHAEPNRVMLAVPKYAPREGAGAALQERAQHGERVVQVEDALWIHFPEGAGRSKITPALLDRLVGSPVTMRNWRTAVELRRMAVGTVA